MKRMLKCFISGALLFSVFLISAVNTGAVEDLPVQELITVLKNTNDYYLLSKAASALIQTGPPAIPSLIKALKTPDIFVRRSVINILVKIGPDAIPALNRALEDPDIRVYAADALGDMGPQASESIPVLISKLEGEHDYYFRSRVTAALGKIGSAAVPSIVKLLKSNDESLHWDAAQALGNMGPEAIDAVPDLIRTFKTEKRQTRDNTGFLVAERAVIALGKIGSGAVPHLVKCFRSKVGTVRRHAVEALRSMGPLAKDAVPYLLEELKDKNIGVSASAASALIIIDPGSVDRIPDIADLQKKYNELPRRIFKMSRQGVKGGLQYYVSGSEKGRNNFYMPEGKIAVIEEDNNHDYKTDIKRYFVDEECVCEEYFNKDNKLIKILETDFKNRNSLSREDTNGDSRFDSIFHYINRELFASIEDIDHDGSMNVWSLYKNKKLFEQKLDEDGDGLPDYYSRFDSEGLLSESSIDADKDGIEDTFRLYSKGELTQEMRDENQDGRYETVTDIKDSLPVKQKQDTNQDGDFDLFTSSKNGIPFIEESDTDFDGTVDRIILYDSKGFLKEVRVDSGHTGHIDQVQYYRQNKKIYLLTRDINADGIPDVRIFFNNQEKKEKIEEDTNLDGKFDAWKNYGSKGLVNVEKDTDADGRVDLVSYYSDGEMKKQVKDEDGDGRFELTQTFNLSGWTMVVEKDADNDGNPEMLAYYSETGLKEKKIDNNSDGKTDRIESYNSDGKVIKIAKDVGSVGMMNIYWYLDSNEEAVRAEKDTNLDGKIDAWFHFSKGQVTSVEEDTNYDGNPDLLEKYN